MSSFPWASVLHVLMTLISIPYILLAAFFVGVGRVASQRGLWAILDTFLDSINWALTWGICGLGVALITICAMGSIEPLRWWATLTLLGMLSVTLCILLYYRASFPSLDELVLLAPAIIVLAICFWRLIRHR